MYLHSMVRAHVIL